ncbi:sugar kinase [Streptomyces albireticuli]|uniref:sugar kinase n=1 Tax=Streptomyces albireticuli TaxID=1940 RepID=UPI00367C60E9
MSVDDGVTGPEVVCLGEAMVAFRPSRPGRLGDVPSFERGVGGAEANVACALAAAGHRARWIGRVGTDGFGDYVLSAIAAHGVDVSQARRDPLRPTGIYFRTAGERAVTAGPRPGAEPDAPAPVGPRADGRPGAPVANGSGSAPADSRPGTEPRGSRAGGRGRAPDVAEEVRMEAPSAALVAGRPEGAALAEVAYYRAGSAASAMSPALVPRAAAWAGRVLHLTGITPALSADCLALVRALTDRALTGRPLLSFDVNYRVDLWRDTAEGPAVLAELARRCDLVFVGEDEAEAAWGLHGPAAIRAALPEPDVLVVKRGAAGAVAYVREPGAAPADPPGSGFAEGSAASGATAPGRDAPAPRTPGGSSARSGAPAPETHRAPNRSGSAGSGLPADRVVSVPALRVDVVAPVGAGDAFAAGFLSGALRGLGVRARLRHGHLMAAAALTSAGDLGTPPRRADADRLTALDDAAWGRLRLGPGWTDRPPAAEAPYTEVKDRTA